MDLTHLISTRYSFHPTEQVPVYRGRGSGRECRDISVRVLFMTVQVLHSGCRGQSWTKTEILHSAALKINLMRKYI